jgi:hypothetical protein
MEHRHNWSVVIIPSLADGVDCPASTQSSTDRRAPTPTPMSLFSEHQQSPQEIFRFVVGLGASWPGGSSSWCWVLFQHARILQHVCPFPTRPRMAMLQVLAEVICPVELLG